MLVCRRLLKWMGRESVCNLHPFKMNLKFLLLFCCFLVPLVHGSHLKKRFPIRRNPGALRPPKNFRKSDSVETKYFNQYLDHFTPSDTSKWKQARHFLSYFIISLFHRYIAVKACIFVIKFIKG